MVWLWSPTTGAQALGHAERLLPETFIRLEETFLDGQLVAIAAMHGLALVRPNLSRFSASGGLLVCKWFLDSDREC